MSANMAIKLWSTLPRLAEILGIELAFAQQAYEIRKISAVIPSKRVPDPLPKKLHSKAKKLAAAAAREAGKRFDAEVAIELRYKWKQAERRLSPPCEKVAAAVARIFPPVIEDREMGSQLQALGEEVLKGRFVKAAGM